jgi:L-lysine 6-transaminase
MLADGDEMVIDLERSHGTYIYDSKHDREFLDFATCFASMPIGYNHPELLDSDFQEKLAYVAVNKVTNSDYYTVEMAEFVDTFSKIAMPKYLPHLFLIEGGALAVENALKTAFDWRVRKNGSSNFGTPLKVIYFNKAFHGRSGYTLSITNTHDLRKTMYFPKFNWINILAPVMKFPFLGESYLATVRLEEIAISGIKDAIEANKNGIAAIIIEPIQGEGGDNHFRLKFFKALKELADENDIFLILDEVQTGMGLTGKMWAHQHFGIEPDIVAFGKKTQVCGIMCGKKVDEVENNVFEESSRLNSTWGGNLVDMVRSQKYLEIIEKEKLVENADYMGYYLLRQLRGLQQHYPEIVSNVRGRGLMIAIDLPSEKDRNNVIKKMYKDGMVILGCGEKSIRFRPPLNVSEKEIDEGLDILETSIKGGIK